MLKHVCVLFLCIFKANSQIFDATTFFANSAVLGTGPSTPTLNWNFTTEDIIFKVTIKTTGWVGFGLSPNGDMRNSDIFLAVPKTDGTLDFTDRHIDNSYNVLVDTVQNWKRLFYSQTAGVTTIIVTRKLKICNPDQPIEEINIDVAPTSYVIYASAVVSGGSPLKHLTENRGSKSLPLLTANKKVQVDMTNVQTYDFRVDAKLKNNQATQYYCHMFKLPTILDQTKHHAIRMETLIKPGQEKYVHHWTMNECTTQYESEYLQNNSAPIPGLCDGSNGGEWSAPRHYCRKSTLVWATGGDIITDFPVNMGYPIGGDDNDFKYFFLEMHYENEDNVQDVTDDSGLRLYVTQEYRPVEFGVFSVGALVGEAGIIVPPQVKSLNIEYLCPKNAINKWIGNNKNVTIFAHMPHTHLIGTSFYSTVVRDKKEVAWIGNNKYFDFNYQYLNFLPEEVVIQKDDEVFVKCVYNTEKISDRFTTGGLGTHDEMCIDFIWYYPRNKEFPGCYEYVDIDEWVNFFDNLNKTGQINWKFDTSVTFFTDGLQAILDSDLVKDPANLEKMFQDLYNSADRAYLDIDTLEVTNLGKIRVERLNDDAACASTFGNTTTTLAPATTKIVSGVTTTKNGAGKLGLQVLSVFSIMLASLLNYF